MNKPGKGIFTDETTEEDLIQFARTLRCQLFHYRDVVNCYAIYMKEEYFGEVESTIPPEPRYSKPNFPRKKVQRQQWTDEEVSAIIEGIKEFGKGHWNEIYNARKDIFDKKGRTPTDINIKYNSMRKNGTLKRKGIQV